jgi:phospho-N-acetylmuramoyl-pentapeptide-transferase
LLYALGHWLHGVYGPFRLLTSHSFLGGVGIVACAALTWILLPKLAFQILPRDRGRAFAHDAKASEGKPTGAGVIFVAIFLMVQLLVLPPSPEAYGILALTAAACWFGFADDRSKLAWGEYKKGLIDLIISAAAAAILCHLKPIIVWLPFTKVTMTLPPLVFIPLASVLLWTTINATNCTDGVDGLSGTLVSLAFIAIGGLMYFVLGHEKISEYLLLPHIPDGASWAIMAFSMVGCLAGYLWYNAHPSQLLMGDAGSRALGFLLGVLVIASGNPFMVFVVSSVLLVNGGTGLVKVALLRFTKIAIFKNIRFPLHDHFRHKRGWSNPQVLVRFTLVQSILSIILIVLLVKVR